MNFLQRSQHWGRLNKVLSSVGLPTRERSAAFSLDKTYHINLRKRLVNVVFSKGDLDDALEDFHQYCEKLQENDSQKLIESLRRRNMISDRIPPDGLIGKIRLKFDDHGVPVISRQKTVMRGNKQIIVQSNSGTPQPMKVVWEDIDLFGTGPGSLDYLSQQLAAVNREILNLNLKQNQNTQLSLARKAVLFSNKVELEESLKELDDIRVRLEQSLQSGHGTKYKDFLSILGKPLDGDTTGFFDEDGRMFKDKVPEFVRHVSSLITEFSQGRWGTNAGLSTETILTGTVGRSVKNTYISQRPVFGKTAKKYSKVGIPHQEKIHNNIMIPVFINPGYLIYLTVEESQELQGHNSKNTLGGAIGGAMSKTGKALKGAFDSMGSVTVK